MLFDVESFVPCRDQLDLTFECSVDEAAISTGWNLWPTPPVSSPHLTSVMQ